MNFLEKLIPQRVAPQEKKARVAIEETDTHISYLGETLEKATAPKNGFVPEREKIEQFFVNDKYALELQQKIATAMGLGQNLLIEGGTALGKTTTVAKMCAELGYELHYVNLNGQSDVENLMGRYIPNLHRETEMDSEYQFADGSVTSGMRQEDGKIKVILLDEINATHPGVLKRLNEVLNAIEQDGSIVLTEDASEQISVSKATTKVVALMNPSGEGYLGVNPLSKELINRFVYQKEPSELPRESFAFRRKAKRDQESKIEAMPASAFSDTLETKLTIEQYNQIPHINEMEERYEEFHFAAKELLREKKLASDQSQTFLYDDQRESDRVTDYVLRHYRGDISETFQRALEFYYLNKLDSQADRKKLDSLIKLVSIEVDNQDSKRHGIKKRKDIKKEEKDLEKQNLDREEKILERKRIAKESVSGRDSEYLINGFFRWYESRWSSFNRNDWNWQISYNGIVNIKVKGIIPGDFLDEDYLFRDAGFDTDDLLRDVDDVKIEGKGIDKLISELQGKKVLSYNTKNGWFLFIL